MGLLRLICEFDILLGLFLLLEVGIPILRDRPKFPYSRRILKIIAAVMPNRNSLNVLVSSSKSRYRAAQLRLEAADRDRRAAELEKKANSLEDETNQLRIGDPHDIV
jgi:hypothetical protein